MKIAPGIEDADWKSLDLSTPESPDWGRAISTLEQRLRGRFTDPVEFLIADDEKRSPPDRRFGFVILAIDCMLVETLQAFRLGLTDTRSKSQELCTVFLTTRDSFKHGFTTTNIAVRFYKEFRCGLLHNAQVFGTGRIWSIGPLLKLDGSRMTVNRTAFHRAVLDEIRQYLDELRDPRSKELRERFRVKMDFVAEGKFVK